MDINASSASGAAAPSVAAPIPAERLAETREIVQAVKAVNASGAVGPDSELEMEKDPRTRQVVVRLVDRKTKEVLSQIPAEYVLRLAEEMRRGDK
jgi:uncharacterized FlaG/YvyC family protein